MSKQQDDIRFLRARPEVHFDDLPESQKKIVKKTVQNKAAQFEKSFHRHGDAEFYSRELTDFYVRMLMKVYPDIFYREYLTLIAGVPWKKFRTFEMTRMVGNPSLKNHSAKDSTTIQVAVSEFNRKVHDIKLNLPWDYVEIDAARGQAAEGGQIEFAKLETLRRANEQMLNELILFGSEEYREVGLTNNPLIPSTTSTSWEAATPSARLNDIVKLYSSVVDNSKRKFNPNVLAMSNKAYQQTLGARSDYVDTSIIGWVRENLPTVTTIIADAYLDGVGTNGSNMIMAIDRQELNANMSMHMYLVPRPPVLNESGYSLPYITRCTGANIIQATSIATLDGI